MHVHSATLCSPFWIEELRAKRVAAFECLGPVGPSQYSIDDGEMKIQQWDMG